MDFKRYLVALFIATLCVIAYIKHTRVIIEMNGEYFTHAGMAELQPGIYAPVYRRLK